MKQTIRVEQPYSKVHHTEKMRLIEPNCGTCRLMKPNCSTCRLMEPNCGTCPHYVSYSGFLLAAAKPWTGAVWSVPGCNSQRPISSFTSLEKVYIDSIVTLTGVPWGSIREANIVKWSHSQETTSFDAPGTSLQPSVRQAFGSPVRQNTQVLRGFHWHLHQTRRRWSECRCLREPRGWVEKAWRFGALLYNRWLESLLRCDNSRYHPTP